MACARLTLALATFTFGAASAFAQAVYPGPDAAANAFVDALASNDHDAMKHVLGNDFGRFIPTRELGEDDIYAFLGAWAQGHEIVNDPTPSHGRPSAHLAVGTSGWTLPVPLVQTAKGWRFDLAAAKDEILTRRIGRNEHAAMMTSLAYLDAQNDYHAQTQRYAQRIVSTSGQRDGLYWPAAADATPSPLGPLAEVMAQTGGIKNGEGYHGYHYRILTAQGPHAKGGGQSYLEQGAMTKGFGLIAWPVEYGKTGVMSFIVNQEGQLYQKNLGPKSASAAAAIKTFDPDPSWQAVQP
ncbi:DUF2950 domain-containing protein [Paraburkholderia bonniea]|nr:DUF2950 domain-containing protein [Paraburkholderia bonniea]WJF91365.1 DUF2950 domain-containing protein [Paraburkholderia bonniea]WJF94681.1 DUF2950 domain-containing protein [Paraburkholderia bonniea]